VTLLACSGEGLTALHQSSDKLGSEVSQLLAFCLGVKEAKAFHVFNKQINEILTVHCTH